MNSQHVERLVGGVDLADVRNRNELRVVKALRAILEERGGPEPDTRIIREAYVRALNRLPPRYAQHGTIILRDPVRHEEIQAVTEDALRHAVNNFAA